jgi:hypothetical protein
MVEIIPKIERVYLEVLERIFNNLETRTLEIKRDTEEELTKERTKDILGWVELAKRNVRKLKEVVE